MEKQSPPPAPACKQSGNIMEPSEPCPHCGVIPDEPSFCLWLNHSKIHRALAVPGAPCAQGASEQESAFLFAEVTWKIACGAISPAVTYRDHVPTYMCEGKWRDHPFVLHRLKMSDCNKLIHQLQKMYASPAAPGVAAAAAENDVERSPLIIQSKTCKECMKMLSETKTFESIQLTNWRQIDSGTITTIVSCICAVVNPRRACAVRVTVVVLCVCLSVCQYLFSHYRLRGGL